MAVTLRIPGQPEPISSSAVRGPGTPADAAAITDLLSDVEVVHSYSLAQTARGSAPAATDVTVDDDAIVEIDVDGFQLWTSAKKYEETVRAFRPTTGGPEPLVVDTLPNARSATRGDRDRSASAVRILSLGTSRIEKQLEDPRILKEFAEDFGFELVERAGSWVLAKALVWLIERRLKPREGLYTWTQATRPALPGTPEPLEVAIDDVDANKPILLFLHGTGSNTVGSFGEFLEPGSAEQWNALAAFFEHRIYAYEHKTLSRSPIENAVAIARRLPANANLYLISHSRGGMIGDLLCLRGLDTGQIAAVTRHGQFDEADKYDRDQLTTLSALLSQKQFRVQRFARAACPARGTLLASENLDQFLSVITYLLGLIPALKLSPIYEVIKRIALETAHRRWEPGMLPGLEAMTPSSPLVRLLNTAKDESVGSLAVVAGDVEGGNWLKRFGVFISDRMIYENRDNDLVVNTDSMFRGAARAGARYVFDQGADVSHFNYFKNRRTRMRLSQWMTAKNVESLADFRPLEEALIEPVPMKREGDTRAAVNRPVVVLVPDLMGSDLHDGATRVWRNYEALSKGAFSTLAHPGSTGVRTESVLGEHYGPLREFLANTHAVEPFAYDWRLSTTTAADALSTTIETLLERTAQPVSIVAHGMGALVVRQLAVRHARILTGLSARKDARLILLGAPNAGTFDAVELLLGTHPLAQQLALLDPRLGRKGVIEILQSFPGVLELLPRGSRFFARDAWSPFTAARARAELPDGALLAAARAAAEALDTGVDLPPIGNVAGTSTRTVCGVELRDGEVTLQLTTEGDGRVPHESTRLRNVTTWYADADHGGLTSDQRTFAAIRELLQTGEARQLPTTPPSASRGGEQIRQTPPEHVLYPTDSDLLIGAFGQAPRRGYRAEAGVASGFRVSVVHGDLTFARFPIIVGHYEGDTIIGPESVVDRLFDYALTTRYHLGLYPGPLGTFAVVFRDPTPLQKALQLPPGAIVVGLGRLGELTTGQIANIVRRGALEYVLQLDTRSSRTEAGGATGSNDVGLSVLLIGATASNMSTEDSVAAILRGIAQANLELGTFVGRVPTRIAEIEIVELYVDTAIEAARAVRRMAPALSDELKIAIDAAPLLQRGRHGRVRWAASRNLDAWRRWEITAERSCDAKKAELPKALRKWLDEAAKKEDADPAMLRALAAIALVDPEDAPGDRLRFVSLSDRARAEVMMEQHQPALIERLIASSITNTVFNQDAARALFELMVPNDLKDGLGQLSNVVFVLDDKTAAYPWELMNDGGEQPLCTRVRIVRQLQSASFRPHIRVTTSRTAYIVGDPRVTPPFQQLDGARAEAQAVAEKLSGRFEPILVPPRATALDVLGGLFARPYRILHLAGHGDYRPADGQARERSGMVLDNGVFLTAAEVRKMVQVPELVFLNCCFIGQVGPEPVATTGVPFNRLAASISRELIEMGVRAVVAAGWAVRDDAALHFAGSFYDEMLSGATFGRALAEARKRTWHRFRTANTWGAYQAYGDPDFRFEQRDTRRPPPERVAHEELLEQIDRIWRQAKTLEVEASYTAEDTQVARVAQVDALTALVKEVPSMWLNRSDVRVAVAEAYGELGAFATAIEHFEFALDTGELDSKTTIKAAEQLLNFRARQAAAAGNEEALKDAIKRLSAMQEVGPTSERFSLLGGTYKRLATLLQQPGEVRTALAGAIGEYEKASQHEIGRGKFNHYPIVNMLSLKLLLGETPDDLELLLRQSEANARERFLNERSTRDATFHAVAPADIAVVRALAAKAFDEDNQHRQLEIARIGAMYRDTLLSVEASPRQVTTVVKQLSSLATFVEKLEDDPLSEAARLRRDALAAIGTAVRER